jgi:hypothetical protein
LDLVVLTSSKLALGQELLTQALVRDIEVRPQPRCAPVTESGAGRSRSDRSSLRRTRAGRTPRRHGGGNLRRADLIARWVRQLGKGDARRLPWRGIERPDPLADQPPGRVPRVFPPRPLFERRRVPQGHASSAAVQGAALELGELAAEHREEFGVAGRTLRRLGAGCVPALDE